MVKICTFSLDVTTIMKLNNLLEFWHTNNKSGIVSELIEREYRKQIQLREDAATH